MWLLRGLDATKVAVGYFVPSNIQGMAFQQVFVCTGDADRTALQEAEDKVNYLNGGLGIRVPGHALGLLNRWLDELKANLDSIAKEMKK